MKILDWNELEDEQKPVVLARPPLLTDEGLSTQVRQILANVRERGDGAVLEYTLKYDGVSPKVYRISKNLRKAAWDSLEDEDRAAIELAVANVKKFHAAQKPKAIEVETMPGVICRREVRPLSRVGLYVPGGTAPLLSTLIMLAIPALIAGVRERVVVSPPGPDGQISPYILAAAYACHVTEMYAVGGAQAIGALGYGTKTIAKCDKIFGPGNAWVAEAKAQISSTPGGPAIDLPAGPSEVMVLADHTANPAFVAADLLSQAEHDKAAQVVCLCQSGKLAKAVIDEISEQLLILPRAAIAREALKHARLIIVEGRKDMIDIANSYAPEHLIVQLEEAEEIVPVIQNAGSIFLGPFTPEAVGDYASGTNHTLPTAGAARAWSGLTLESFMKYISVQSVSREGLEALGPAVERLADMEGLDAHRQAVAMRLSEQET
ncbi:MAG TPA: histidinol dehydrogenase [Hellea balneolensis]|uniref:Histidinol dehydrogenase n=1 Tax=Hellea balneolensis TaxID=287478 RepID=A0A7V5NWZ3_9PROT|nr:histidinol dehydrogenase [Hellea balneolensis]